MVSQDLFRPNQMSKRGSNYGQLAFSICIPLLDAILLFIAIRALLLGESLPPFMISVEAIGFVAVMLSGT